jgi:hypothetical protein
MSEILKKINEIRTLCEAVELTNEEMMAIGSLYAQYGVSTSEPKKEKEQIASFQEMYFVDTEGSF